jgi:hypothetical protein
MTGTRSFAFLVLGAVWVVSAARADLAPVRAETNLERRSDKALDNAEKMVEAAEKSYKAGDSAATSAALEEVKQSVELSFKSLHDTGKDPRKSPGHFKRAEIKTREMLRRLRDFQLGMAVDERDQVEAVRECVRQVHEDLLSGILLGTGGWKKK